MIRMNIGVETDYRHISDLQYNINKNLVIMRGRGANFYFDLATAMLNN